MKNMGAVIKSHNQRVIKQAMSSGKEPKQKCNCRQKEQCPLQGKCLETSLVYKATIQHGNEKKHYYGLAGGTFKERYRNHVKSMKHEKYRTETQLSKYIWKLKESNTDFTLTWEIEKKSNLNLRKSGLCNLCLDEKFIIISSKEALNKRSEIISKCRHRRRPPKKPPKRDTDPSQHTNTQTKSSQSA